MVLYKYHIVFALNIMRDMYIPMSRNEIKKVLQHYDIDSISRIEVLKSGRINKTYHVKNVHNDEFIVQTLHKMWGKSLMEDINVVTTYLSQKGWDCPRLLRSRQGEMFCEVSGNLWRIYTYVKGNSFLQWHIDKNLHNNIGSALGLLHKDLRLLDYNPRHMLEGFHKKDFYIQKAISIDKRKYPRRLWNIFDDTIANMEKYGNFFSEKKQIVHGDPRIENILYTEKSPHFVFLDYDTLMIGSVYTDIGDCLRSLMLVSDNIDFKKIISEFILGYNAINKESKVLRSKAIRAVKYVALELSLRFMIDSVEKCYFSWDGKKYKSQEAYSEARALASWDLFSTLNKCL